MRERPLHGGEDRSAAPVVLDFSVNTNPLGMPPAVRQLLREETSLAEQYPDRTAKALRESLAAKWKVPPEQILMGNGASEILMLAGLALAPKEVLIPSPSFSGYARAFEAAGSAVRYLPLLPEEQFELTERFFAEISCGTGAAVLCNPNNPTGRAADPALLAETAKHCEERGITLILDECFLSFLPDGEARTFLTRTKEFPHLLIVRAATKIFALPGLRLGCAVSGNAALLARMAALQSEWSVSSFAQAAGLAALADPDWYDATRELVRKERVYLTEGLAREGFWVLPGEANFLLFSAEEAEEALYEALLLRGIRIRSCSNFRGLGHQNGRSWYRIAVKTRPENEQLIRAIQEIRHESGI